MRLDQARKFYEVAELVDAEADTVPSSSSVATALAVLAGIAASDAVCCAALGRRSRAPDHKAAVELLRQVQPGGAEAARNLDRLLDLKDSAHYGVIPISGASLKTALRTARALTEFATIVVRR